jgi:transposase
MQKLTVSNPKKIERQINAFINDDPEAKFIFRLCSLKMFLNDPECSTEKLGKIMQTSPRAIANWVHNLNETGDIEILRDKEKPGRTPKLTQENLQDLKDRIQKHPNESGVDANLWDGKSLSHYIKKRFGVELQLRQCQRLFKKLGFSLKRGRTIVAGGDPKLKKTFKKTS